MIALALVEMHDLADANKGLLGIFGLAVPDAPAQPLDLRDDSGLGVRETQFVGERSHLCGSGSADGLDTPENLNRNVGVGSGDDAEDLAPPVGCFDVANTNFQMRIPPSQLRKNVEFVVTVMLMAAAAGLDVETSQGYAPILSVWVDLRYVHASRPAGHVCLDQLQYPTH